MEKFLNNKNQIINFNEIGSIYKPDGIKCCGSHEHRKPSKKFYNHTRLD
jgi:hypothetical protein